MNPPSAIGHLPSDARLLVRGTNWLGDAVMATPALLRLREKFPDAHIALLTPEKLKDLWTGHPAVNETISFAPGESVFSVGQNLRQAGSSRCNDRTAQRAIPAKFDLALVLPNSPRSAIETWLAGIPQRIGYARPWRNFFLTQTIAPRPGIVKMRKRSVAEINKLISHLPSPISHLPASAHQIHEYLHLAAALGASPEPLAPQLFVSPDEIDAAKKKFGLDSEKHTGGTPVPLFGLNPGAEYGSAKRWPVERFIAAAREIQTRTNCVWLIFGGKGDTAIAGQIAAALHASRFTFHDLSGKTSLRELMSLLKLCRVLLTNDSGPMHVAAALGTPVVVPFGSTSPELTGPGLPGDPRHRLLKSNAPCSPCFLRACPIDFRCLNGIPVERVVEAVVEAFKG
jgi:heptosyltransferase-2